MEIRFQTRRTGITRWLLSEAINHALYHPHSANYLVYPRMLQRESTWYYSKRHLEGYGTVREIGASRGVEFQNGSVIEFITTGFAFANNRMFDYGNKFMYVDNLQEFRPTPFYAEMTNCDLFNEVDDLFIGGTTDKDGAFRLTCDYKEFCRTHNMLNYAREFDRIHDFIVDTDFLRRETVSLYPPHECEFCDRCERRNDDCLRIGKFFAVNRKCPLYPEILVNSLNSEANLEFATWNL